MAFAPYFWALVTWNKGINKVEHLKNILHIEIINEQRPILSREQEVLQMDDIAYEQAL